VEWEEEAAETKQKEIKDLKEWIFDLRSEMERSSIWQGGEIMSKELERDTLQKRLENTSEYYIRERQNWLEDLTSQEDQIGELIQKVQLRDAELDFMMSKENLQRGREKSKFECLATQSMRLQALVREEKS